MEQQILLLDIGGILLAGGMGMLSFLSPCVLPIIPAYLAYMAGASVDEVVAQRAVARHAMLRAVFFVLGLSTVFLILGASAAALGRDILGNIALLSLVAGVVIMLFGLHFLGLFRLGFLERDVRIEAQSDGSAFGAYLLGLAFAFGWTPCIGPMLGTIILMIAERGEILTGTGLMAAYALGLGLPFILAALFMQRFMVLMRVLRPHMALIEKLMGALLVLVGLAMATGLFSRFSFWLLEIFPSLAELG